MLNNATRTAPAVHPVAALPPAVHRGNQFRLPDDDAEVARWGTAAAQYHHHILPVLHQNSGEVGWISRAESGDECLLVCRGDEVAYEVTPVTGLYLRRDDKGRLLDRYRSLRDALEAIVPTLPGLRAD